MTNHYLLLAHADKPHTSLIDAETLKPIRTFELPGRIAVLAKSSDSRYGFAIHRDDACLTIVSAEHGIVTAIIATGLQPTHLHAYKGYSILFNDGSGDVIIFDEHEIPYFEKYPVKQADHGSALIIGEFMIVGYLRLGSIEVYRRGDSTVLSTFECCPMLHGATQIDNTALFGCSDGVLLLKHTENDFVMSKITNPKDTAERIRVGSFATHPNQSLVLGNFGHGLAVIDTKTETMTIVPLSDYPLKFSFNSLGEQILILTADGNLQSLNLSVKFSKFSQSLLLFQPLKALTKNLDQHLYSALILFISLIQNSIHLPI